MRTEEQERAAFPTQPLVTDPHGVLRFKENRIVSALLEHSRKQGYGLNETARGDFTPEEHMQVAQLIGYSLDGYGTLSYVTDESYAAASALASLPDSAGPAPHPVGSALTDLVIEWSERAGEDWRDFTEWTAENCFKQCADELRAALASAPEQIDHAYRKGFIDGQIEMRDRPPATAEPTTAEDQAGFAAHIAERKLDPSQHPLHYLFLDSKTYEARQAWKAAIRFMLERAQATPPAPAVKGYHPGVSGEAAKCQVFGCLYYGLTKRCEICAPSHPPATAGVIAACSSCGAIGSWTDGQFKCPICGGHSTAAASDPANNKWWFEQGKKVAEPAVAVQAEPVTEFNVGRYCLSEDDCIADGINFAAYERGIADAAAAFARNPK